MNKVVFRRLSNSLRLFLALALLLSLCACAEAEDGQAAAPADAVAEVTEKDPHADDPQLVADRFRYTYRYTEQGKTYEHLYSIPKLLLDSPDVTALNKEIYDTLYDADLIETVENNNKNRDTLRPFYDSIGYSWAVRGDILSLVIQVSSELEPLKCYVYNLSIERKGLISDAAVYEAAGMNEQTYHVKTEMALSDAFNQAIADWSPALLESSAPILKDCLQATISEDNLKRARPYFDPDGTLYACGFYYAPASGDQTAVKVVLEHLPPAQN